MLIRPLLYIGAGVLTMQKTVLSIHNDSLGMSAKKESSISKFKKIMEAIQFLLMFWLFNRYFLLQLEYTCTFQDSAAKHFNSLPAAVKSCPDFNTFSKETKF